MSDNLYRVLVVVLLAGILGVSAYASFAPQPGPSEACLSALEDAQGAAAEANAGISSAMKNYTSEVYERADNINQQTFLALERAFILQIELTRLQEAALRVQTDRKSVV